MAHAMNHLRGPRFRNLSEAGPLDVLVVGGGMTGAPIYHQLCARGHRVALVDKGDFSSGTSQASGMLVWGGLLYLKNFDLFTVLKLCKARKDLLRDFPEEISVLDLRYLASPQSRRSPAAVWLFLHLYWLMGGCALNRPSMMPGTPSHPHPALIYQEAMLRESDSRFVIDRIRSFESENSIPLNHCRLVCAIYDKALSLWNVDLRDEVTGAEYSVKARAIVNGAGVWTDEVNRLIGLESPYKHVFSKGVYLAFPNDDGQTEAHVYPMHDRDDVMTHVPWGPVTMWGPTETTVREIGPGLAPDRGDVQFLLDQARRSLPRKPGAGDVISMRCGIRPLAVPRNDSRDVYPLELSRRHQLVVHHKSRAMSLYGGKLTSSLKVAEHVADLIDGWMSPRFTPPAPCVTPPEKERHPELGQDFVSPEWARDHESCLTLDDYLRRRTSIAQWMPRMGLGTDSGNRESLLKLAGAFTLVPEEATAVVDAYERMVRSDYDPLLEA